jgi:hypothetical protein
LNAKPSIYGVPADISTSYVERSSLSMRMACRRFTRLTNGFSKKVDNHAAAVSLYVAHYNLCRVHRKPAQHASGCAADHGSRVVDW